VAVLYLDEDVTERLVIPLHAHGHQVVTTTDAGRKGTRDHEQLWFAARLGWTVLTVNRRDFESLHGAWLLWEVAQLHAGIILLHAMAEADIPRIAAEIDALLTDAGAFFAAHVQGDKLPTVTPVAPTVNRLYRRWSHGQWDCIG